MNGVGTLFGHFKPSGYSTLFLSLFLIHTYLVVADRSLSHTHPYFFNLPFFLSPYHTLWTPVDSQAHMPRIFRDLFFGGFCIVTKKEKKQVTHAHALSSYGRLVLRLYQHALRPNHLSQRNGSNH
jgi:hypothetical protein